MSKTHTCCASGANAAVACSNWKRSCNAQTGQNCCCSKPEFGVDSKMPGCSLACSAQSGCANRTTAPFSNTGCTPPAPAPRSSAYTSEYVLGGLFCVSLAGLLFQRWRNGHGALRKSELGGTLLTRLSSFTELPWPNADGAKGGSSWLIKSSDLCIDRTEKLGSGAFASVFKGDYCGGVVAVKELRPLAGSAQSGDAQEFMNKLFFECQLLSTMNHPHIVKFFGLSRPPGPPPVVHIVTEFCGSDLARTMCTPRQAGHSMPKLWLTFAKQITGALQYIHSKGIIHRDLKPANVLVTAAPNSDGACVKLCDFGISTLVDDAAKSRTATSMQGTPAYMAPEVADDEGTRYASAIDVYSLGVLLWAMWTGCQPYHTVRGSVLRLLMRVMGSEGLRPEREFEKSEEHGGETATVPWCLWRLLIVCWAPDPHTRHSIESVMAVLDKESFVHDIEHHHEQAADVAQHVARLDGGGDLYGPARQVQQRDARPVRHERQQGSLDTTLGVDEEDRAGVMTVLTMRKTNDF